MRVERGVEVEVVVSGNGVGGECRWECRWRWEVEVGVEVE